MPLVVFIVVSVFDLFFGVTNNVWLSGRNVHVSKCWAPASNMFGESKVIDIEPNITSESKMLITKINI